MPFMLLDLHARIKDVLRSTIRSQWNIEPPEISLSQTPKIELGELATPVSLALAKQLQRAPRGIAEELIARAGKIEGMERMEVGGAGYINFYVDRAATLRGSHVRGCAPEPGRVIVRPRNVH